MLSFRDFLLSEAPLPGGPAGGPPGLAAPASLPPGGPAGGPPGLGGPPPPMGGMGGGAPPPPMGMGGAPPMGGQPPMKLQSPDVWKTLEQLLGLQ